MPHNAQQLLWEASDCGIRITGLDGWTQTRLAQTLKVRRETLNAIINRAPGAEPTDQRPRMVEACQKLIAFAAALSAKEDAILKLPIDAANLQSDDGQAYEHHRLRLHRLVEEAAETGRFTEALCRIGEFASAALHAAPKFKLRMLCNLVTAIQRLLDKPGSRDVAGAIVRANLARLYRAERAVRRIGRERGGDRDAIEQSTYARGQAGYGLVYCGMLLGDERLIQRGGRRLTAAVAAQPDPSYGHWCNWQRAANDLLASWPAVGEQWARTIAGIARSPRGGEFRKSYEALVKKGEIQKLREHWQQNGLLKPPAKNGNGTTRGGASLSLLLAAVGALTSLMAAPAARAGDGRDFRAAQQPPQQSQPAQAQGAAGSSSSAAQAGQRSAGAAATPVAVKPAGSTVMPAAGALRQQPAGRDARLGFAFQRPEIDSSADGDVGGGGPELDGVIDRLAAGSSSSRPGIGAGPEAAWGERIQAYLNDSKPAPTLKPEPAPKPKEEPSPRMPPQHPGPVDPAVAAERALQMARNYLAAGNLGVARQKLQRLIETYPDTKAAQEAATVLRKTASADEAQAMAR